MKYYMTAVKHIKKRRHGIKRVLQHDRPDFRKGNGFK